MPTTLLAISSLGAFGSSGGSCDYPAESDVREGVEYDFGAMVGTFSCSPVSPSVPGDQPFALIASLLVARVAAAMGTTTTFVRPVANADYRVTETENLFGYLQSFGPSPINPTTGTNYNDDGAGRWRRIVGRRVRVYIYERTGTDSYGSDDAALLGADPAQLVTDPITLPGIFALEEAVLNALDNLVLTYVDDEDITRPLTIGPIHWVDSESGPAIRKPEGDVGLVRSHLDFQVCYCLAEQRTEPAPSGLPAPNPM